MIAKVTLLAAMGLAIASVLSAPSASAGCDWTNAQSFVNSVLVLDQGYVLHDPGSPAYQPPMGQPLNLGPSSPIVQDLLNAFNNAPPTFKQKLCGTAGVPGLSAIFINASQCAQNDPSRCNHTQGGPGFNQSWGFRSHPDPGTGRTPPDSGATYIAIAAADLWQAGGPARSLSDYETQMLRSFPGARPAAITVSANPDASWMSVLAAMAHEVGHVNWARTTIPIPGRGYDFRLLIPCPSGDFFAGWSYDHNDPQHRDLQPLNRWRLFANRQSQAGQIVDHAQPPLFAALDNGFPATALRALFDLLQPNQVWASLFGAQTPDEDFVETYALAVLTGYNPITHGFAGPLTSMAVNTVLGAPDVANDLMNGRKPALRNKIECIPF